MPDQKGCSAGQLAIAWLLAPLDIVPVPGTKRRQYLRENVAATTVAVSGECYAAAHARTIT